MTKEELYEKALSKYGDLQLSVAMEECSELIKAISKYIRSKDDFTKEINAICDIAEEIADVEIMTEQLIQMLQIDDKVKWQKEQKLKRLEERLTTNV